MFKHIMKTLYILLSPRWASEPVICFSKNNGYEKKKNQKKNSLINFIRIVRPKGIEPQKYNEKESWDMNKTVYIEGDGCNRRLLEVEKIKSYLEQNDYRLVNNPKTADYIVLSTCAFKKKEEDQSVSKIRDFRKYDGEMLVYGCLPDIAPQRYREFEKINHLAPKDLENIDQFFEGIKIEFNTAKEEHVIENKFKEGIVRKAKKQIIKR